MLDHVLTEHNDTFGHHRWVHKPPILAPIDSAFTSGAKTSIISICRLLHKRHSAHCFSTGPVNYSHVESDLHVVPYSTDKFLVFIGAIRFLRGLSRSYQS